MTESGETLLEFPCRLSVKAFGRDETEFKDTVYVLIKQHVPDLCESDLTTRVSGQGSYVAITAMITADSKAQLDAIYADLSASPSVIMSL